jgi:hypothetical protein
LCPGEFERELAQAALNAGRPAVASGCQAADPASINRDQGELTSNKERG